MTRTRKRASNRLGGRHPRRGAATIDYVLTFAIVLPLAAFLFWAAPRIMNLVYEMTTVLVSWPFSWGGGLFT